MKVCLVGEGAQGLTHMNALRGMEGIEVVSLAGGIAADAEAFAREHGIGHVSTDLEECLDRPGVEAAVITSPNQLHCEQAVAALERGLHVLLELPMGLSLAESRRVVEAEERSGKVAMMCHTQRYRPEFRRVHRMIAKPGTCTCTTSCSRPTSSAASTRTASAGRASGPTTCCGTRPAT